MASVQTTTCRRYGHPEFRVNYDPALVPLEEDVRWLLAGLERSVAAGERFTDGQTFQVGWMVTLIRDSGMGLLSILEPDIRQVPVAWVDSVGQTLAQLRVQKDVCESVFSEEDLSFPSAQEAALICTRLGGSQRIVMERSEPQGADSGWFCGCDGQGHNHNDPRELLTVSLYEAAVRHAPQIVPYLALPPGVLLTQGGGPPAFFRHGRLLVYKPESYLAAAYRTG